MHIKPSVLLPWTQSKCWQGASAGQQTRTRKNVHITGCMWSQQKKKKVNETGSLSPVEAMIRPGVWEKDGLYTLLQIRGTCHICRARSCSLQFHSLQKRKKKSAKVGLWAEADGEWGTLTEHAFNITNPNRSRAKVCDASANNTTFPFVSRSLAARHYRNH